MSKPISEPFDPPQLDRAKVGIADIATFTLWDRQGYRARFGQQFEPFDPSRPVKRWWDSTHEGKPRDEGVRYRFIITESNKSRVVDEYFIHVWEALEMNLPGPYEYAAYEIQPTQAIEYFQNPTGGAAYERPVDPGSLATRAEAESLAKEIDGTVQEDTSHNINWKDEKRRLFRITARDKTYSAGWLAKEKSKYGVGRPGYWADLTSTAKWVKTEVSTESTLPEFPIPVRALLPNERLHDSPFGPSIMRTDFDDFGQPR